MYEAQVVADSISPEGVRLTSIEVEYPHAIHKDMMTHRALSRNFQSFRAFPPEKVIEKIEIDPFIPESFDYRVKGMGQGDALDDLRAMEAHTLWMHHIEASLSTAEAMIEMDLAKAQVNFVLQDLTSIRGIITATEWDNFWGLRLAINEETGKPYARPEVYKAARMMKDAFDASTPTPLKPGEWHVPYIDVNDFAHHWKGGDANDFWDATEDTIKAYGFDWERLKKISTGRCARISYLTHDGKRDWAKDIQLYADLKGDLHMSPFEHQATPMGNATKLSGVTLSAGLVAQMVVNRETFEGKFGRLWSGNFRGWEQHRKEIPNEGNALATNVID